MTQCRISKWAIAHAADCAQIGMFHERVGSHIVHQMQSDGRQGEESLEDNEGHEGEEQWRLLHNVCVCGGGGGLGGTVCV